MKKIALLILSSALPAFAVWWFAVPSRHDRVMEVFDVAQVGDSRKIIHGLIGAPSHTEISGKGRTVKEGLVEESYQFFLARYAFYYDTDGRLSDKYKFLSE
jgi:hypothetical protein